MDATPCLYILPSLLVEMRERHVVLFLPFPERRQLFRGSSTIVLRHETDMKAGGRQGEKVLREGSTVSRPCPAMLMPFLPLLLIDDACVFLDECLFSREGSMPVGVRAAGSKAEQHVFLPPTAPCPLPAHLFIPSFSERIETVPCSSGGQTFFRFWKCHCPLPPNACPLSCHACQLPWC